MRHQSTSSKAFVVFLLWTGFGLAFAGQTHLSNSYFDRGSSWARALGVWLIYSYAWALMTPAICWLTRRFPLERTRIASSLFVHFVAGAFFSVLSLSTYLFVWLQINETVRNVTWLSFQNLFVSYFLFCFLTYLTIVGLTHAYDYYNRYRERELAAAQLQTQLTQAQLDALKLQLHPHFLFNTLNTISVLMNKDVKVANRMLGNLSDLLRAALKNAHTHEVSLRQELEFLNCYLEIEQTRFSDRLKISMQIDPNTLDACVPSLILQPLVENAIRYGIGQSAQTGHVEIRAARSNGTVELNIRDDGPGLNRVFYPDSPEHVGLANTRARLAQLYGSKGRFQLTDSVEGGAIATISIPYRRSDTASNS